MHDLRWSIGESGRHLGHLPKPGRGQGFCGWGVLAQIRKSLSTFRTNTKLPRHCKSAMGEVQLLPSCESLRLKAFSRYFNLICVVKVQLARDLQNLKLPAALHDGSHYQTTQSRLAVTWSYRLVVVPCQASFCYRHGTNSTMSHICSQWQVAWWCLGDVLVMSWWCLGNLGNTHRQESWLVWHCSQLIRS